MVEEDVLVVYGDGIHDDTEGMQHYADGGKIIHPDGTKAPSPGRTYLISKTLEMKRPALIAEYTIRFDRKSPAESLPQGSSK